MVDNVFTSIFSINVKYKGENDLKNFLYIHFFYSLYSIYNLYMQYIKENISINNTKHYYI